ncbi:MAG: cysteine--tRNA ligase [Proteobacteria bacterium]|nr:cysteine--tRNA ligase [Pseudomonadota bacterium]
MAKLHLHNTLTRKKEPFEPIDAKNIRMYVCGPTVYDFAHIGNARPVIVFDVLFRLLRHLYGADHVTYARNITDVDDKINKRAFERWDHKSSLTKAIRDLTDGTLEQFHKDVDALGCLRPTHEPRATDFVSNGEQPLDMVRVIEKLIANGNAYAAEGHVLFNVPSMEGYGALARRPKDDMIAGARVEVAPYKRDPMDFVLWKPSDPATEPGWDSPWGYGRPGWHIECSAMSGALLGEVFDIHAGGLDLIFPHHENEIAQSCCAFGKPGQPNPLMARYWLHNGFLQVEGQKMSKSLGNFRTIREVLNDGWSGEVVRLTMLKTHYRQPIDWTLKSLEESQNVLDNWATILRNFAEPEVAGEKAPAEFIDALADDLNISSALAVMHGFARGARGGDRADAAKLFDCLSLLGIDISTHQAKADALDFQEAIDPAFEQYITAAIEARLAARAAKNWAESDRIRDELASKGIQLKDGKDANGNAITTWEVKR